MESAFKTQAYLFIAFILFLVITIVTGHILNKINLASAACKAEPHIAVAHKWSAWAVAISSTGMALSLIVFILLFFVEV